MKALLITIFVALATIVNAQKLEFDGYHSKNEGSKTFYEEKSYFEWDVDKEDVIFLDSKGLQLRFKISHIEVVEDKGFNTLYFLSNSGLMLTLYYKDSLDMCMIVVGSKTYSGKIVKFE